MEQMLLQGPGPSDSGRMEPAMTNVPPTPPPTQILADWQEAINCQASLLSDPEGHVSRLTSLAKELERQGQISKENLHQLLDVAAEAHRWAIQELLTRELNR
jgi:hypothetical protein